MICVANKTILDNSHFVSWLIFYQLVNHDKHLLIILSEGGYVTAKKMDDHIDSLENPHNEI